MACDDLIRDCLEDFNHGASKSCLVRLQVLSNELGVAVEMKNEILTRLKRKPWDERGSLLQLINFCGILSPEFRTADVVQELTILFECAREQLLAIQNEEAMPEKDTDISVIKHVLHMIVVVSWQIGSDDSRRLLKLIAQANSDNDFGRFVSDIVAIP